LFIVVSPSLVVATLPDQKNKPEKPGQEHTESTNSLLKISSNVTETINLLNNYSGTSPFSTLGFNEMEARYCMKDFKIVGSQGNEKCSSSNGNVLYVQMLTCEQNLFLQ
jgi:hypothetical protein